MRSIARSIVTFCFVTALSSCADPVGSWSITSWAVQTSWTHCDGVTTHETLEVADAGTLTVGDDGVVELSLDQVYDHYPDSDEGPSFRAVDEPQVDTGHLERDSETNSFCVSNFCGGIDVDWTGNSAIIDTVQGGSLFEPCGSSTIAYRMDLVRR